MVRKVKIMAAQRYCKIFQSLMLLRMTNGDGESSMMIEKLPLWTFSKCAKSLKLWGTCLVSIQFFFLLVFPNKIHCFASQEHRIDCRISPFASFRTGEELCHNFAYGRLR